MRLGTFDKTLVTWLYNFAIVQAQLGHMISTFILHISDGTLLQSQDYTLSLLTSYSPVKNH